MNFKIGEKVRVKNFEDLISRHKFGNGYFGISKKSYKKEFENKILEITHINNIDGTVGLSNENFIIESSCLIKLNKINLPEKLFIL